MQRRKFLVGMGSLAAGASTVMGTGALSQSKIERGLRGTVAADSGSGAYVKLKAGNENGHFVQILGNGQMQIRFDNSGGGEGLNPDSLNYFDNLFDVVIQNVDQRDETNDYEMWITENTNNNDLIDFYQDSQRTNSIVGQTNARGMGGNGKVPVGVTLDLRGSGLEEGNNITQLFGGPDDRFVVNVNNTAT